MRNQLSMNSRLIVAISAIFLCSAALADLCNAPETPLSLKAAHKFRTPQIKTGKLWWGHRFVQHLDQIVQLNGQVDLVFCGDSITHNWERKQGIGSYEQITNKYSVLNLGYGGDGVQHLLWRLENGELDGYKTKGVMLLIGTNYRDKPANKAAGIRKVLDVIQQKQPQAKILLLPIFPRGAGPEDERRMENDKVNEIIRTFADGERVIWVDFTAKFLDEKGDTLWIMPDRVHPNQNGYKIWMEALMPYFKQIVGK